MKKLLLIFIAVLFMASIAFAAKININTAGVEELSSLKGIGLHKAEAIIQFRKLNGPFKSVDDVTKVKGIGPKLFEQIKGDITVGDEVAPAEAESAPAKVKTPPAKTKAKP